MGTDVIALRRLGLQVNHVFSSDTSVHCRKVLQSLGLNPSPSMSPIRMPRKLISTRAWLPVAPGCHCNVLWWANFGGVDVAGTRLPLQGAIVVWANFGIAGCHCSVLWWGETIAGQLWQIGCGARVPSVLWGETMVGRLCGSANGSRMPLLGAIAGCRVLWWGKTMVGQLWQIGRGARMPLFCAMVGGDGGNWGSGRGTSLQRGATLPL